MRGRKKKIIIPVSGGKDSLLCLLLAIEIHGVKNCIPLFNDTGWEHPETYSYLKRIENHLGIVIERTIGGMYSGTLVTNIEELIIKSWKISTRTNEVLFRAFEKESSRNMV